MLDIKFIRKNPDKVREGCEKKGVKVEIIGQILEVDKKRREVLQALEDIRAKKNKASKEITAAKDEKEKQKIILEMRELDKNNDKLDENFKGLEKEFNDLMLQIPNLPFEDVPVGKSDKENVILRKVGERPKFGFTPKDYLEIAQNLDLIDVKRAAKVSGTRFGYIKGKAALLEFALLNFVFDRFIKENK